MCGICGVYNYNTHSGVESKTLGDMLQVIHHRGPDDEGLHVDGPLGIGIRRLSIIDLEGGRQPIFNEDGSVVVVFNGEIYNYRELTCPASPAWPSLHDGKRYGGHRPPL